MRAVRGIAACLLAVGLLGACGGGGGGAGERPSSSAGFSPSRTLPSPTREQPSPTRTRPEPSLPSPDRTRTEKPGPTDTAQPTDTPRPTDTPQPTDTPRPTDTPQPTDTPRPTRSAERPDNTTAEPTPTEEATGTPASTSASPSEGATETAADADDESGGVPTWVWLLLAAVVVLAAAITWALVSRARRSREWRERLGAAETEVTWFAHELLPELRSSASLGEVAGGWRVGVARVTALEDELTVLGSSAPTESESHRAMELRAAVRLARDRLDALARAEDRPEWALDLDDVKAGLDTVLQPAPSDSVP